MKKSGQALGTVAGLSMLQNANATGSSSGGGGASSSGYSCGVKWVGSITID